MQYIYIGDITNTHGLKGELRIVSDFKYKNLVFKKGMKLYVGSSHEELVINTYRTHKMYDMVTFEGVEDITDAVCYKGDKVYIDKKSIEIDGFFDEDIIGLDAYDDEKYIGKVENILKSPAHDLLLIVNDSKHHMVPYINEFIKKIDLDNNKIFINTIEGLIDED